MQGLNHVVFGSLIGLTIKQPALAVPLALGSHFALDMIPHYGEHHLTKLGTKLFHARALADIVFSFGFGFWLLSLTPPNPQVLIICMVVAVLPDLLWPLALYIKHSGPVWAFFSFHKKIQHESPWGIYIEIIWFLITGGLVYRLAV
ncbi:MAG: hypothetical protein WCJ24_00365 [Candidatus Saccharibacteria bacterium]